MIKGQRVAIKSGNLKLNISGRKITPQAKANALKLAKEISDRNKARKLKK